MNEARRTFLRSVMSLAWRVFRQRHIPGCNVRTFADALRNAWGFLKAKAAPAITVTAHLSLNTMLQSPIRRSLTGQPYAYTRARAAGRVTSMVGR